MSFTKLFSRTTAQNLAKEYVRWVPWSVAMVATANLAISSIDKRQSALMRELPLYYGVNLAKKSIGYGVVWPLFFLHVAHPDYRIQAILTDF